MMKMKRLITVFIVLICLAALLSLSALAATTRMVDDAKLLPDQQEAALLQKLNDLSAEYGHDIVIVTVESLGRKTPQKFAEDYYISNGFGQGSSKSGILLLVSMEKRDYWILTRGDAVDIFSESDLDSLESAFLNYLSDGYYDSAFNAFADRCEHIIKYDKRLSPIWIVVSLIVGVVVAVIVINSMRSKHKNVKPQRAAGSYMLRNTFRLDRSRDVYLYSLVTRRLKPKSNSSSGGGGSSGRSGGRGGKF